MTNKKIMLQNSVKFFVSNVLTFNFWRWEVELDEECAGWKISKA